MQLENFRGIHISPDAPRRCRLLRQPRHRWLCVAPLAIFLDEKRTVKLSYEIQCRAEQSVLTECVAASVTDAATLLILPFFIALAIKINNSCHYFFFKQDIKKKNKERNRYNILLKINMFSIFIQFYTT